jgi:MFS family permease
MDEQPAAEVTFDQRRLFLASCIALITTAMTFSVRADILNAFGAEFNVDHAQQGWISYCGLFGFPIAILLVGPLVDSIGMGRLLKTAAVAHILGVIVTIISPALGFPALLAATLVIGFANGTVEAVINPLVATIFPTQKAHKLSILHAWWPGGLVIGGLTAYGIGQAMGEGSWRIKMATIIVGAVVYLVLVMGQEFPKTERVAAGVSNAEMLKAVAEPGFLFMMLCMCMTAITELGPDQWVGSVMGDIAKMSGILILVYTSVVMFLMRFYAGPVAHKLSPFGLLCAAAAISSVGLFMLSSVTAAGSAFVAATVFAVGKAYFWPMMLGVANERYPRTGSLGLALMGAAGMIAASLAGPTMGRIYDRGTIAALPADVAGRIVVEGRYSPEAAQALTDPAAKSAVDAALAKGASAAFRAVAKVPLVLVVLFGVAFGYFRSKGGYQAVRIDEETLEGGVEAPVE